jgi:hypothetical protein
MAVAYRDIVKQLSAGAPTAPATTGGGAV